MLAIQRHAAARSIQNHADQLREFAVAQHRGSPVISKLDLFQNLASRRQRLYKYGPFVAYTRRNHMKIFERKRKIFSECPVVSHNPEHGPPRAVRLQPASAELASWCVPVGAARDIDLARHALFQPFLARPSVYTLNLGDFSHELMPGSPVKVVVTAKNLEVGVADPRHSHAHEGPATPQSRLWLPSPLQSPIAHDKTQHQVYFSGSALRLGAAMRSSSSNFASSRMSRRSISWQVRASSLTVSVMVLMRFSIKTICRNASKASRGQLTSLSACLSRSGRGKQWLRRAF